MAGKKTSTHAQKAASGAQRKQSAAKKNTPPQAPKPKNEDKFVPNLIASIVCFLLFLLFLVTAINPDGVLLVAIRSFMTGLFGTVGFYFSIPAMLFLTFLFISSRGKSVTMQACCLIAGVLCCSCIHHLVVNNQMLVGGIQIIKDLYIGGTVGTSGGVICGGIAILVRWIAGGVVSYIIFGIAAVITLLASLKITIPSILRAIENRPRDEFYGQEFDDPKPEPAAVVVNHIANKRIAHNRQKRENLQQKIEEPEIDIPISAEAPTAKPKAAVALIDQKASDMMNQIEGEISEPVAAASNFVSDPAADEIKPVPAVNPAPAVEEDFSEGMPLFEPESPIPPAPKTVKPRQKVQPAVKEEKVTAKDTQAAAVVVAEEIAQAQENPAPAYVFPPISLLNKPSGGVTDGTAEMRENTRRLNDTLASFKIDAHIINVTRGPSVTRYEVELEKGVRLNKLTTCANDIALSLGASGVRIAAIPGKISVVGIEVPNQIVTNVYLREVIDSAEFTKSASKSSFAVGKDIGGTNIIGNIAKMPHLLIAGTTGSGKSVCMNSVIISLLYKASPEDVKLIMIDPKMVELGIYNGIPHLLIPVVTDPKKAAGSLQWAVTEMMRRYKIMADAGVRDLKSFNEIVDTQEVEGQHLPQVVIIIDELADLMLVAAKEVEDSICRIAQMGRAAGMHLIIATQRPSADVITGLMKANIPSRIAFAVASTMESRIILDTQGAEKLVGKGDMLYAPIGTGKPQRVQGCFVTDAEVEAVAGFVKENYNPNYDQSVLEEIEKKAIQSGTGKKAPDPEPTDEELEGDEMLPAAVDVILETGQASVSMLQRRLKLGYARAARIVDEMEEKGIVGPFQGSKPRAILITKEQWAAKRTGGAEQLSMDDLPFDEDIIEDIE